jgi:hypothetical protein
VKVYRAHRFNHQWRDVIEIKHYANPHKAMAELDKIAGCYVEWKQMSQHHYAGLTSGNYKDDFYIVYVIDVIE